MSTAPQKTELAAGAARSPNYAELIVRGLKEAKVEIVASLPESLLKKLYPMLQQDNDIRYIQVSSETDLPGIVAGAYFGGKRAVMVMENSGIRQACEPLARLLFGHRIPLVMLMPHRGDLGEDVWWGHGHSETMLPLLDALRIRYWLVNRLDEIVPMIKKALIHADAGQVGVALIFSGECREQPAHA
jgi:sulfopyruvate decarboxylase subunit alpha